METYIKYAPLSYYFQELVDIFVTAVKDIEKIEHDQHHEVELIIFNPPLITLTNLYNIASNLESYIEFTMVPVKPINTKFRTRISLAKIHGLDIKNNQLVNSIDTIIWNKKTVITTKEIQDNNNCIIKHSLEEQSLFMDYRKYNSSIKLELVNLIQAKFKNIIVDIKIKYFLGSGAQSVDTSSLLYALNHPKNKPHITLEFEILPQPTNFIKQALLEELTTIGNALFLGHPSLIRLCPPLKLTLLTQLIKKQDIVNINTDNLYITSKTDGILSFIYLYKDKLYSYFTHLGYIKEYAIQKTIKVPIYLYAEMTKEDQVIYLTVIKIITPAFEDRLLELDYVNQELLNIHERIIFKTKPYQGPFESSSELIECLDESLRIEAEGIILFYATGPNNMLDYKVKRINTIDQCLNVIYRYMSSEPIIYNDKEVFLEYKRYSNDGGIPREFAVDKMILGQGINYINNIYCLEFTTITGKLGFNSIIVPIKFIAEFDCTDRFVQVRLDKTMKYYTSNNYYGNQLSVIITHISDQKLQLKDMFEEDKLAEAAHNQVKDTLRLNPDGTYFTQNRVRGIFGVLSNYVKTLLISLYCSKTYLNNPTKRKVLAIDFGNGADLEKYFYGEIALMVATDPDEKAIETGKLRYNKLNSGDKSKYYKFTYIKETIRSENYVNSIRQVFYFGKFNIVDWQFAIHYSFHPRHFGTMMHNINELTEPGSKILITTMDGDYIAGLKEPKKFIIHKALNDSENFISIEKIDEEQVLIYNPSSMSKPMVEYIVKKDNIIKLFKEYNFEMIDRCSFAKIINRNISFLNGVARLEQRHSTKKFFELNRNALADCEGTDTLELLRYYIVYVFCKV